MPCHREERREIVPARQSVSPVETHIPIDEYDTRIRRLVSGIEHFDETIQFARPQRLG